MKQEYMKYNLTARIVFGMFARTCFNYLESVYNKKEVKIIKKNAKQRYKKMLERTPCLGKNSAMLLMPMVMFSMYQAVESGMEEAVFAEMLDRVAHTPLFLKIATKRQLFTDKFHKKTLQNSQLSKTTSYPIKWEFSHEIINADEYLTTYTRCGLCELAKKENCFELAKYFCKIDYIIYDCMGAVLDRKMTIANGDSVCDFHVIRK